MKHASHPWAWLPLGLTMLVAAGCADRGYVKQADYDARISQIEARLQNQENRSDQLEQDMQQKFAQYDASIRQVAGRIQVDSMSHFAFDDATLQDQDKPMLDDFAKVIGHYHPYALVTVEGFADPAGSHAYNQRLGEKRAQAVRDYLVNSGGLSADKVRAVSYGEARDRQDAPGKTRDEGMENRRVTLVVDLSGHDQEQRAASATDGT
ncbi:OmpA family protein [Frateuria sp. MAH-13]|uniref:OmpA family protein n=1 Tax=Frateuria flava TaxID=2821489 RepID=A0ABS4DLV5_9GAMM|nr:OmpA family protein [Frateuria flava]MBP1474026.1 OmpA family protein [Frateuria flava]